MTYKKGHLKIGRPFIKIILHDWEIKLQLNDLALIADGEPLLLRAVRHFSVSCDVIKLIESPECKMYLFNPLSLHPVHAETQFLPHPDSLRK